MILYLYAPLLYRRFSCAPVLFLMQNLPFSTLFCILHFCIRPGMTFGHAPLYFKDECQ